MATRLQYETIAGNLASLETFKQLCENLRLAEEDCRLLAVAHKGRADTNGAAAWGIVGNNFRNVTKVIEILALHPADPSSIGYASNATCPKE